MSDRRTDPFSTSDSGSGASALTSPVPASSALGGIAGLWPPASALLAFRIGAGADTASGVVRVPSTGARPSVSLPARDGVSSAFFIRFGAICAALYACSACTRRAPRLPDLVVDHGDDGVVGDASLARTMVVQNVTEAMPTLFHVFSRNLGLCWGEVSLCRNVGV